MILRRSTASLEHQHGLLTIYPLEKIQTALRLSIGRSRLCLGRISPQEFIKNELQTMVI